MDAQFERDNFWGCFDEYVNAHGNQFFVSHEKNGKNQAAGTINNKSPMAMQTNCCEYKYREQVILVQVYINGNERLFDYLYEKQKDIENNLGYSVEWINNGKISSRVRRIQKRFFINKSTKEMVEEIYPYILDFIRVFSKYLKYV